MCGILGVYNYSDSGKVSPDLIQKMSDLLSHRGPDGQGKWFDNGVALGHRRLAILDLSSAGHQPMLSKSGRLVITFNGEIYNYQELRKVLEQEGSYFSSTSDTEVLLEGFEKWGYAILDRLIGMYAFAIWDKQKISLFIARDKLGIKPLYYADSQGSFRFASEIKSLLADRRVSREFDYQALDQYFALSYISAPSTGFKNIKQLKPGSYAEINYRGVRLHQYYSPKITFNNTKQLGESENEDFRTTFQAALLRHTISDVPIGIFLSGGLDSAAIAYGLTQVAPNSINAYTASFKDRDFDESDTALEVAKSLKLKHTIYDVSLKPEDIITKVAWHLEDPFADSSSLAVYQLCQAARKDVKVVLSGDGADELLAGYSTYRAALVARSYRLIPKFIRHKIILPFTKLFPRLLSIRNTQGILRRFVLSAELGELHDHTAWRRIFSDLDKQTLYSKEFYGRLSNHDALSSYFEAIDSSDSNLDLVSRLLEGDLKYYLPNDMLLKMDRMSMAHGLEIRLPFLDTSFVDFALNLPIDSKLHKGKERKYILKRYLSAVLPEKIIQRKKTGFNVPLERWMRYELQEIFNDLLSSYEQELSNYFKINQLRFFCAQHGQGKCDNSHQLFSILMFMLWIDRMNI